MDEDTRAAQIAERLARLAALSDDPERLYEFRRECARFDPERAVTEVLEEIAAMDDDLPAAAEAGALLAGLPRAKGPAPGRAP